MTTFLISVSLILVAYLIIAFIVLRYMEKLEIEVDHNMDRVIERHYHEEQMKDLKQQYKHQPYKEDNADLRLAELELQRELNRIRMGDKYPTEGFNKI